MGEKNPANPATEKSFFVRDGKLWVCEYEVTKSPVTGNNIFFKRPNSEREATAEEKGAIQ